MAASETDRQLATMERKLAAMYRQANKGVGEELKAYLAELAPKQKELSDAVKAAETPEEKAQAEKAYKAFLMDKTVNSGKFQRLSQQMADDLLKVNRQATQYVNGQMPDVYAKNYNAAGKDIKGQVKDYRFDMVDTSTVQRLAKSNDTLLPYKTVNGRKDVRWNTKAVNSEILQGINAGESIPKIAARLSNVTAMNAASAVRNARTATTSAQNRGRMDSYHKAQSQGIKLVKIWLATNDGRTRDAHYELNGQERDIDEPFENSIGPIMFPGDPNADPANVYNCRCTLVTKVVGFGEPVELPEEPEEPEPIQEQQPQAKPEVVHTNNMAEYDYVKQRLVANNITFNQVGELAQPLSTDEIVAKVGGGDMTGGSCASLGFAYIGNTCGIDVTDFRGGNSQAVFSRHGNIQKIFEVANAKVEQFKFDKELKGATEILKNLPVSDKEYYFCAGKHAAIIRKDSEHGLQYLELQSATDNGWHDFNNSTLQWRFGCRKTADVARVGGQKIVYQRSVELVDVSTFQPTEEFKELLGYMNTAEGKQKKGGAGHVK